MQHLKRRLQHIYLVLFFCLYFTSEPPPLLSVTSAFANKGLELKWKRIEENIEKIVIELAMNNDIEVFKVKNLWCDYDSISARGNAFKIFLDNQTY